MNRVDPLDVLSALVLEDGRTWGQAANGVQWADARAFFDMRGPRNHYNTRARGYSKTADTAGYWIADALTGPTGARSYWLAADAEQGGLALDSIRGYLSRTPALDGQLEVQTRKVVAPITGGELIILPADAPSAWGLRPRNVFVDEFAQWAEGEATRALWMAVRTALAKNPSGRLLVITTAGRPDHPAYAELEHARRDPRWRTSETDGPAPWMNADAVDEQRAALPVGIFDQLFMNRWTAVEGAFLDPADVEAAFVHAGPALRPVPGRTYFAGLDLGTVNDAAVLAVVHAEGRVVHLDHMMRWQGSRKQRVSLEAVAAHVEAINERFRLRRLNVDPWQAELMIERLEKFHGVRAAERYNFSTASKSHLASTLLQAIRAGSLHLYPAQQLREELLGLRLVPLSGGAGFGFDHARTGHDDTVVALALAMVGAGSSFVGEGGSISKLPDRGVPTTHRGDLILVGERYVDLPARRVQ
jgi:hypothetical protein